MCDKVKAGRQINNNILLPTGFCKVTRPQRHFLVNLTFVRRF